MVKRKFYILILLSICFIACCYKGPYTSYGSIRQKIRPFSKITENYELIDTTALYKLDAIQEYTHYNRYTVSYNSITTYKTLLTHRILIGMGIV